MSQSFISNAQLVHFTKVDGSTTDKMVAELNGKSIADAKTTLGDKYSRSQCSLTFMSVGGAGITKLVKPELYAMYNMLLAGQACVAIDGYTVISTPVADYVVKGRNGQPDRTAKTATVVVNLAASETVTDALLAAGYKPVAKAVVAAEGAKVGAPTVI